MSLRDRIPRDNHKVFMNPDHFAEEHTWNGKKFTCVPGDTQASRMGSESFSENTAELVIYVPEESLPARAQPNEVVLYDRAQMRVISVTDAIGMKEIRLDTGWSQGVIA